MTVQSGFGASGGLFGRVLAKYGIDYRTMPRRVLTFSLNGSALLPPAPPPLKYDAIHDPTFVADPQLAERGHILYAKACTTCHGFNAFAAGAAPDLRVSAIPYSRNLFGNVVRDGALLSRGMPQFSDLAPQDMEAIRFYLRTLAEALPMRQ